MASTYTQNAGIEKPGTGDQSGTWGVTTNTNFDIIDRAVHGQVTISSIAGNTVLTTSDGALSNGIAPVIILTGSPGATFELRVTPTDQKKHYTIKNETDGACRVIYQGVTYSTSNGVEIAANSTQAVTGDGGGGSGVFKSLTPSTDLINDLTPQLGGDLDVVTHDIVSTSNRNIDLVPHGTGDVTLQADTVQVGDSNADATITSNGTANLILSTNGGTNSGTITIEDGVNNDISVTPNGTGSVILDGLKYPQADGSANQVLKTDGSGNLAFADASSSLGSTLTLGGWTISVDSNNDLNFTYGGTIRVSIATNGAVTSGNDITAFGSP
jgi:hypothetical protein